MINFSSMLDGKDEGHLQEKGVNEVSVFILRAEKTDISQQNKPHLLRYCKWFVRQLLGQSIEQVFACIWNDLYIRRLPGSVPRPSQDCDPYPSPYLPDLDVNIYRKIARTICLVHSNLINVYDIMKTSARSSIPCIWRPPLGRKIYVVPILG